MSPYIIPLADLTEKDWQRRVVEDARAIGWSRIYHTHTSKHSQAGFPDLVLVRARVVFLELKTEAGKLTPAQHEWLKALFYAGAEVYVARPRHEQALVKILAGSRPGNDNELRRSTFLELQLDDQEPQ